MGYMPVPPPPPPRPHNGGNGIENICERLNREQGRLRGRRLSKEDANALRAELYALEHIVDICEDGSIIELTEEQKALLEKSWRSVVPRGQELDFLRQEAVYCEEEHDAFVESDAPEGSEEKENLRTDVLRKRAEFLELFENKLL